MSSSQYVCASEAVNDLCSQLNNDPEAIIKYLYQMIHLDNMTSKPLNRINIGYWKLE